MSQAMEITAYLLLGTLALAFPAQSGKHETGFLDRHVTVGEETYRYQVYVPADWSSSTTWPVILFLHGAGERGEDGLTQTQVGIGTAIRRFPERFPSIVVMPQCRNNVWWSQPEMEAQALKALDQSIREFNGDRNRVYLTGLSMGGYGTWSMASNYPRKFAALAPICGGILPPSSYASSAVNSNLISTADPYTRVAKKLAKIPVWIFHGDADQTVPVTESRKMNQALRRAGANVKYSEYEGVEHNSWDQAYAEPELPKWLFSQRLGNQP